MKSWLQDNNIEMHFAHNEGKSVVAERFFRTLKNQIYKYMTAILQTIYVDKLDDIVNKHNKIYHSTSKRKPVNVKSSTYFDLNKENNKEDSKIGEHVRVSKYKIIFTKGYVPNQSEKVFVIKEVRNTVL